MKLATIETIKEVNKHPNADVLDIVKVKNYNCIVGRDSFKVGDLCVFIQPDTVLPDIPVFELFNKRSNRVKAIRLRNVWSFGIVMDLNSLGLNESYEIGTDVSDILGVVKYEAPIPQVLDAVGNLPHFLSKTDEERYQNLENIPYGSEVDVTLKIDGQSATYYCKKEDDGSWKTGVCSRGMELKKDSVNNYTAIEKKYDILNKLQAYCEYYNVSLAIRGEIYGNNIQAHKSNPHCKLPLDFAAFSIFNIDTMSYESDFTSPHYLYNMVVYSEEDTTPGVLIPVVPLLEYSVELTSELIKKYEEMESLDSKPFEGVVFKINGNDELKSFKVINLNYDSKK